MIDTQNAMEELNMDKNEFKNMVEKYKSDLMRMAGLKVNAEEIQKTTAVPSQISPEENAAKEVQNEENKNQPEQNNAPAKNSLEDTSFPEDPAGVTDDSGSNTYQDFMEKNKEYGYLKVQAFAASQALPIEGVKVVVSKKFSDMEKIFFEGVTDESGIIDDIKLPAPSKALSEHPSRILPYSIYNFFAEYPQAETETAPTVQIFQGIKTIQPVRVIL